MDPRTSIYSLNNLEIAKDGKYPFPNMPCGVLPFYLNVNNEIIWGCVESNRVGPIVFAPPAGTQDIIICKGENFFKLEVAKPLPKLGYHFLKDYEEKNFNEKNYQDVITLFLENDFDVYLENPINTALHETYEEHGIDLREKIGKDNHLILEMLEFAPQEVKAKRGTTTQKIIVAQLLGIDSVELKFTDKIEQKIQMNKGRKFYERGDWKSLIELKAILTNEKSKYNLSNENFHLSKEQLELCFAELRACESRLELLEKIENSVVNYLNNKGIKINSQANMTSLPFHSLKLNRKITQDIQGYLKESFFKTAKAKTVVNNQQEDKAYGIANRI